jgi:heat shock protein HslJ
LAQSSSLTQSKIIVILLLLMAVACTPSAANPATATATAVPTTAPQPEATEPLMIRIHNNSSRDFDSVEVQFPSQTEQYGPIAAGGSSDYHPVSEAYRYAYVKVTNGADEFVLQPIDYVGESLLSPGEYSYVLGLDGEQLSLTLATGDESLGEAPAEAPVTTPTVAAVPPTEAPVTDLNGTSWQLIAYGAPDRPAAVLPNTQVTAEFQEGQISGSTGCNNYSASVSQSGAALTTGPVASTRRACAEDVGQQEAEVLQGVDTALSFEISNDTLTIQHENGVLVFMAAPAAQPETAVDTPETILILSPGPGSAVTSPIVITGESDYAFEGTLAVEVTAVDTAAAGPVGSGFAMLNVADIGQRGPFSGEVTFTAPAEPVPGRIAVFMISARDGHVEHLASVPVTLLPAGGSPEIIPADSHPEAIAITSPEPLTTHTGGSIQISGYAAPTFEQNLVIEVLDGDGLVVGEAATIIASDMGEWGPFEAEVSYSVTAETPGALCATDYSPADGEMVHRTCLNITLAP